MTGLTLEVEGLDTLAATMARAGGDIGTLKDAPRKASVIITARGRAVAPRRTGRLASSIRPTVVGADVSVTAGGSGIRYAGFAEFGSSKIRAHRYMHAALMDTQGQWLPEYQREIERALAQIKGA